MINYKYPPIPLAMNAQWIISIILFMAAVATYANEEVTSKVLLLSTIGGFC
jgi:hypothetical protein